MSGQTPQDDIKPAAGATSDASSAPNPSSPQPEAPAGATPAGGGVYSAAARAAQAAAAAVGRGATGAAEANASAAGAPQDSSPGPDHLAAAEARVAELDGQIGDLTDRLLRAHAELDNVRKRAEREKGETAKYAVTKFAEDMVAIADNLQRALGAVPVNVEQGPLTALLDGVRLTDQELLKTLERHGVRKIPAKGLLFDPHVHQAVMEQDDPSVPSGTVLQVYQDGFVIEERTLRPAMVIVSRGGPKPGKVSGEPSA